jgi:hypothetical protein
MGIENGDCKCIIKLGKASQGMQVKARQGKSRAGTATQGYASKVRDKTMQG